MSAPRVGPGTAGQPAHALISAAPVIPDGYHVRQLDQSDAEAMAAAYQRNVAHLGPWEPIRPDTFYTVSGQREAIEQRLEDQRQGRAASWVVVHGEAVVGQVTLSNVARGVFQSCAVGYWVDGGHTGRGLGTVLLEMACQSASSWGLHRVEAATLVSNGPSQAVLAKCGFELIGSAPAYLFIAGRWHDHRLYQRVLHDRPPGLDL